MSIEYFPLEGPRVSRDAALEFMVHHLQLAHACFQNTIDDADAKREEAQRLFLEAQQAYPRWADDGGYGRTEMTKGNPDAPEIVAGMEWLARMEEIYEDLTDAAMLAHVQGVRHQL